MTLDEIEVKPNKTKTLREYSLLQKLKKLSSDLTLCHFDAGVCIAGNMACCKTCAANTGYLKYISSYPEFDEITYGFLDIETGCNIPLELRPVQCISFLCDDAKAQIITDHGQEYLDGLIALKEIMEELEGIIKAKTVNE